MRKLAKVSHLGVDTKGMDYISIIEAADLTCRPARDVKRLVSKVLQGVYPESMVRPDPGHEGLWQIKKSFVATVFSSEEEEDVVLKNNHEEAVVSYLIGHLELKNQEIADLSTKLEQTTQRLRNVQRRQVALAQPKPEVVQELRELSKPKENRFQRWAGHISAAAALFLLAFLLGQAVNQHLNDNQQQQMAEDKVQQAPTNEKSEKLKQVATD